MCLFLLWCILVALCPNACPGAGNPSLAAFNSRTKRSLVSKNLNLSPWIWSSSSSFFCVFFGASRIYKCSISRFLFEFDFDLWFWFTDESWRGLICEICVSIYDLIRRSGLWIWFLVRRRVLWLQLLTQRLFVWGRRWKSTVLILSKSKNAGEVVQAKNGRKTLTL